VRGRSRRPLAWTLFGVLAAGGAAGSCTREGGALVASTTGVRPSADASRIEDAAATDAAATLRHSLPFPVSSGVPTEKPPAQLPVITPGGTPSVGPP
jgi:hypothetical protein